MIPETFQSKYTGRKMILVALLSLCLALFLIPLSFQSVGAGGVFNDSVRTFSSLGTSYYDPYYGTSLTEVVQGSSLNVTVSFQPSYSCQKAGCNLSIGFGFDTLPNYTITASGYTNASNANPHNTFTALPNQQYIVSFSLLAPKTASTSIPHNYLVAIVNYAQANNASSESTVVDSMSGTLAIISPLQGRYWGDWQNLTLLSNEYGTAFSSILSSSTSYQYSQAVSFLSMSAASSNKADLQYSEGNFAGANSSEVLALNQYQQAIQSYQTTANALSTSNNNYMSLVPYGAILLGIGALIAGIGLVIGSFRKSA